MIPLKNILRRKTRNFLTILGISIGVAVFVTLLSISTRAKSQLEDIVMKYKVDIVVQQKAAVAITTARIPASDYKRLQGLKGVSEVLPLTTGYIKTPWSPYFLLFGVASIESLSAKLTLKEGRLFKHGQKELILGAFAAKKLGYHSNNKIVLSDNEIFTITGVYYFGNSIVDSAVMLDIKDVQRILKRDDYINIAFIKLIPGSDPREIIERINKEFPELSALHSGDFSAQIQLLKIIELFVWGVSIISLLACCIIIMNTLFMAVTERTKEIGILMAVGWSHFMIFKTIVAEAIIMCVAGGIIGNILSILTLNYLSHHNAVGFGWIPSAITAMTALKAMGLSFVIGIISSLIPAALAIRLQPADALRYE